MKTAKTREAKAMCLLCGDIISSCTEYAEASCGCGAVGVRGGVHLDYRGREGSYMVLDDAETPDEPIARDQIVRCPHCGEEI